MKRLILFSVVGLAVGAQTAATGGSQPIIWAALHEPSCGGWMTSLAVSPHDRSRILLGGDILGIGLSLDGSDSWLGTYGLRIFQSSAFRCERFLLIEPTMRTWAKRLFA